MKSKKNGFFLGLGKSTKKFIPNKGTPVISFFSLFKYAQTSDKILLLIGVASSILSGFALPLCLIVYGEFTSALIDRKTPNATFHVPHVLVFYGGGRATLDGTEEDLARAIREDSSAYGYGLLTSAALSLIFSFLAVFMLNNAGLRQVSRIRRRLIRAILEKDMAWYDVNNEASFAVNLTEDLNNIQEGMGEKIGLLIISVSCFTVCVIIAFFSGWKLTLAVIACIPIIIIGNGITAKVQATMVVKEQKAYSKASGVAEEVFSSIKTVVAFGGEKKEIERYKNMLVTSLSAGIRRAALSGIGAGIMWFIIYAVYALAFWYGVTLILQSRENGDEIYTASSIIIVLFGVIVGAMNIGQCLPYVEAIATARGSATSVWKVINTVCDINPFSTKGNTLPDLIGNISFKDVHFHYPTRSSVQILKGINMEILKGQKVALVGGSGCGKSTCVQLIQRLYDPVFGAVLLDGENIKELNIGWLRSQIGVVSQEPLLFATTIEENIRYGAISATNDDIIKAAKIANAHDFIMKLPKGYQTTVGQKGTQLSGGQKQRIAIARAVVRDPKILLLDEATSALDVSNESAVQKALDHAAEGRTTIVVAHRLSTVRNADRIIVISDGKCVESGTHDELMKCQGEYFRLLNTQEGHKEEEEIKENEADLPVQAEVKPFKCERSLSLKDAEEQNEELVEDDNLRPASLGRILSYSKPEWLYMVIGCLATLVVGASCPIIAVLVGEIYGVLSISDPDVVRSETDFLTGMMMALAVSVGTALFLQLYSFGSVATRVTTRLRDLTFAAILEQEPAWFDREENKVGALTVRLSSSAADIQAIAGSSISIILQGITTLVIGLVLSFMYSWQLTLVTSVAMPLIFFGVYYECYVVQGQNLLERKIIEGATKVAVEAISGIRTVASLGLEETIIHRYCEELKGAEAIMKKKAFMRGVIYGAGQSGLFLGYGLSLWYGGTLVADNLIHYKVVIKVSEALLFGVWLLGQSMAFAPGIGKAKLSAARLFQILDRQSTLREGGNDENQPSKPIGKIDFSHVDFVYPNRPEVTVLQDLSLCVQPGTSVALAGASGCGKSTIIQLIQRLYDPVKGAVCLNDRNIRAFPIADLRSSMSIVSQEPVLFNMTIAENIAYGDNSRKVSREEIIEAAKTANIHNFIVSLPTGYDTNLGKGGTQLSGGQKQRIAIARALIRNPRILLLDEATSALDTASEAVVQAALDEASTGRTTVTVGHRTASIARADVIFVLDHGRIVEKGKYDRLISSKGFFSNLNQQ